MIIYCRKPYEKEEFILYSLLNQLLTATVLLISRRVLKITKSGENLAIKEFCITNYPIDNRLYLKSSTYKTLVKDKAEFN